jgi:hypothetical protein
MFGHLKPEEFMHLIESGALGVKRSKHAESCARCSDTLNALRAVHIEMADIEEEPVEPDWTEFRASVRDAMLSRSVRRESASRRWIGLTLQPGMAWSLSLLLVAGLTVTTLLWTNHRIDTPRATAVESQSTSIPVSDPSVQRALISAEGANWSQPDVFDEIAAMGPEETEHLQQLLESKTKQSVSGTEQQ